MTSGHGKRSGGKAVAPAISNSELLLPSPKDDEVRKEDIPLELRPLQQQQSMTSATFQGDSGMVMGRSDDDNNIESSLSPKELYRSKFSSIFPYFSANNGEESCFTTTLSSTKPLL